MLVLFVCWRLILFKTLMDQVTKVYEVINRLNVLDFSMKVGVVLVS